MVEHGGCAMKAIDVRVRLPEEFRNTKEESIKQFYGRYDEVLKVLSKKNKTLDDLMKEMKEAKVEFAVIHAEYEFGDMADDLNKAVSEIVKTYPDQFAGFGTVTLTDLSPMKLIKQAEEIASNGLIGINLQPVFFNVDPLDRRLYPLYAAACQYGLIVSFHTGIHYSTNHSIIKNSPLFIDQICCDFPDLKVIACHGGWPWVHEMVAVARRHENVFVEFGGIAPKYIGRANSGWDLLYDYMNHLLSDQIIFGTDWPVISPVRALEEWQALHLKPETFEKFTYLNAVNRLKVKGKTK